MIVAACIVTLLCGYALKAQCLVDGRYTGQQWERLCYNDIQPLYTARGIDTHTFPYVNAYMAADGLKAGGIEYPVLTGVFMWATGYLASDLDTYLQVTALFLSASAVLVAWLLHRMSGLRALYWAAAPTVALYAFHNWDLLVVAAAVAALYMWWTGRHTGAAILIGVGGALKLYPLLFLAPLFLDRWLKGDRSGAGRLGAWGLGMCVAINFPFMFANPPSWWLTYQFHRERAPNVDSLGGQVFPTLDPSLINLISAALTAVTMGAVLWWCVRRFRKEGEFPFLQACAALTASFLLWSKVQSPQYMLWLLPFFALLAIKARWWAAFTVVDLIAYVSVFRFYYDLFYDPEADIARFVMIYSVFARAALWAVLILVFSRAQIAVQQPLSPPLGARVRTSAPRTVTPAT